MVPDGERQPPGPLVRESRVYVLAGGWPGSGKTTLAHGLGRELGLAVLCKDELKQALLDALGPSADVAASRRLGRAAVHGVLRLARSCPGAVIDSTWFEYARPLVADLPGRLVELRCLLPVDEARQRHRARRRDRRLLDDRGDDDLWGQPVVPLGVGPLIEVDTLVPVDVSAVAHRVRGALAAR